MYELWSLCDKMSEKGYSNDLVRKAYRRLKKDIQKSKWAILGIALSYFILMQFTYSTCPLLMLTGLPCPFCGMTRAGFSLLHGNFALAFKVQPMIYGAVLLAAAFIVVRYFTDKKLSCLKPWVIFFFAVLILVYICRMIRFFPDEWPMYYYEDNLLRRLADWIRLFFT